MPGGSHHWSIKRTSWFNVRTPWDQIRRGGKVKCLEATPATETFDCFSRLVAVKAANPQQSFQRRAGSPNPWCHRSYPNLPYPSTGQATRAWSVEELCKHALPAGSICPAMYLTKSRKTFMNTCDISGDCDELYTYLKSINKNTPKSLLLQPFIGNKSWFATFSIHIWLRFFRIRELLPYIPDFLKLLAKRPPDWWSTSFIKTLDQWHGVKEYGKVIIRIFFVDKKTRKLQKELIQGSLPNL